MVILYQIKLLLYFLATKAYAAGAQIGVKFPDGTVVGDTGSQIKFWDYVATIINYSRQLGAILAGIVVVYAGILYMTSKGESSKIQAAKEYFLGALIGLAILILIGPILSGLGLPYDEKSATTPTTQQ